MIFHEFFFADVVAWSRYVSCYVLRNDEILDKCVGPELVAKA
jgi:hypothetical protein